MNWRQRTKWLTPGLGIKRWLLLLGIGAGIAGMGIVYLILLLWRDGWLPQAIYNVITLQNLPILSRILLPLTIGTIIIFIAIRRLSLTMLAPYRQPGEIVAETLYRHTQGQRGPHIVALGGGTGLSTLLRGLTQHTRNITAIVAVADDGGSSGRLRRELGMLPPGDIRANMAALARDEALMTQLLQYRFSSSTEKENSSLQGHAFGNLLLAALTGITGSFDEALLAAERVLALRGRVLPSTLDEIRLVADIEDRQTGRLFRVEGESAIPKANGHIRQLTIEPANAQPYPPAIRAIFQADLILLGPGSLYTSILPNLLVPGIADALKHSRAPKVYICNVATQPGETEGYDVAQHVATLVNYLPLHTLNFVLANNNLSIPNTQGGGQTHYVSFQPPPATGKLILADLADQQKPWRHDSQKLAQTVINLLSRKN